MNGILLVFRLIAGIRRRVIISHGLTPVARIYRPCGAWGHSIAFGLFLVMALSLSRT
jgi:hypothetical protein